ncbi:hypothetical protein B0H16DRAFT_1572807 [Mycena metata]|uniref:Uncharacterized protein n=1 Tax=Mycena metata TaxID=1033252 RepID=A0AAD7I8Z4_9AGAR|nr:hypothetical protein B0H16DRAFT_1572807 [Mycena metata]
MTVAHRLVYLAYKRPQTDTLNQHHPYPVDSVAITSPAHTAPQTCRAFVRVRIANDNARLRTENLPPLALKDTSQVTFDLRYRPVWKSRSSQIAETEPYSLSELLEMQAEIGSPNAHISIALYAEQKAGDEGVEVGSLRVTVCALSAVEAAKLSRDDSTISVRAFWKNESMFLTRHLARCKAGDAALQPIYGILEIVGPFLALSGESISSSIIAVVHGVAKIPKAQIAQDAEVMGLLKVIESICRMVRGATVLEVGGSASAVLDTALRELVSALTDCTDFVVDFCESASFLGRVTRSPEKARRLQGLHRQLAKTQTHLHHALLLETCMKQGECAEVAAYIGRYEQRQKQMLDRLTCIEMTTPPKCSEFETSETLTSIRTWATSPLHDGKNILWLQTAQIVANLSHELQNAHQLGGSVFFSSSPRSTPSDEVVAAKSRDPSLVIQTLAVQLASGLHHTPLRNDIAWHIKANPGIANGWLEDHRCWRTAPSRPVVFLLDGLDSFAVGIGREDKEARGEREALERVLRVLVEGSARFPPDVRLLVSGGQGKEIQEILGDCHRVIGLEA